ncbi:porin family protein [Pontibacter sp. SGAir0037]|uniref:porin family protein n=1 Tax=Pontibacter sp. SGAir0037 TaxID=2571030 RepID=UPI0010CD317C|nr:porin family protein [Pontibacter sp. SGAir0037]QCR24349.1 PorT family protein [Pontibacter sp. SGAir0037]
MKKVTFLLLFLCLGFSAMAQVEIGLQVSPTIAGNRFIADNKYNFKETNNNLHIGVGVVVDYFFAHNYAFSSGLLFRSKGGEYSYRFTQSDGSVISASEDVDLQYLEIPVSLKLFTNEVAPDVNLYFQVGGSLNTMISATINDQKVIAGTKATKRINTFEADALLGAGAELALGQSTKLMAGLSYHHGLSNIDNYYRKQFSDKNIAIKNNYVSIDFGIKF